MPCAYEIACASAPRLQPWYSEEPTEEEMEAMKAVTEKHAAIAEGGGSGADGVPAELVTAAEELDDSWDDSNNKEKAQSIVDICTGKIDLPQDEKKARIAVGKILMSNQDSTPLLLVELVLKQFGIASAKEEAKAQQKTAMESSCSCAENAGIIQAFKELGDYYFKDGNTNAGLTYKKAITTLSGLDYQITVDNAKGFGKGKTKLPGIGKGTADKIHEFYSTGKKTTVSM